MEMQKMLLQEYNNALIERFKQDAILVKLEQQFQKQTENVLLFMCSQKKITTVHGDQYQFIKTTAMIQKFSMKAQLCSVQASIKNIYVNISDSLNEEEKNEVVTIKNFFKENEDSVYNLTKSDKTDRILFLVDYYTISYKEIIEQDFDIKRYKHQLFDPINETEVLLQTEIVTPPTQ